MLNIVSSSLENSAQLRAWYGSWPPPINDATEMKINKWRIGEHWPYMAILVLVACILFFIEHELPGPVGIVSGHLATALLVAAVLGLTIDLWLKKQIALDVFRASIGYLLPKEFQNEMRWLYERDLICELHKQDVRITPIADGVVKFACSMERTIRNVSDQIKPTPLAVGVDDWFYEHAQSEILEFGYQIEGEDRVQLDVPKEAKRIIQRGRAIVAVRTTGLSLPAKKSVTYWARFIEVKPANSDHHTHFSNATKNPWVTVHADGDIDVVVAFPRETGTNKQQRSLGSYEYDGLIYPGQEIRIFWWEKAKFAKWVANNSPTIES